jgi:hypothetical protein
MNAPLRALNARTPYTEERSAQDFFTSAEFLKPYGDAWVWAFPRPPMSQADVRGALLTAAEYVDEALDAQIEGNGAAMRSAVEVARSILAVVLGQVGGSSENVVLQ